MSELNNSNPFEISDLSLARYYSFGQNDALNNNASSTAIESSLDSAYADFLSNERSDVKGRITKLEAEIGLKKEEVDAANLELIRANQQKSEQEHKIDELEKDRIRIEQGETPSGDFVSFGILSLITLALTLYLFVFYTSTVYSAFFGDVSSVIGAILRPDAIQEATSKGRGALALIILSPFIFIALGYLIHTAIEENRKREEQGSKPAYSLIASLILFTFIFDALMAYKIAESLHNYNYAQGLTDKQWLFSMIFSDINFYLVLASGFVVYIVWGLLLNNLLRTIKQMRPDNVMKYELERISNKISEHRKELSEIIIKIEQLRSTIKNCQEAIADKSKRIAGYRGGHLVVDIPRLRAMVGQFISGWNSFIAFRYTLDRNTADQLMQQSQQISENWLENKINSLESDE